MVPKIAKRFLFVVAGGVGVIALVLLSINLYLQSGAVQERIRSAAERALGAEVRNKGTTYTPWGGLNLHELSIPDPTAPERNIVEAKGLRVRFPLIPLLSQRFVVRECVLIEPKVYARQAADGNWILPLPARRPEAVEVPSTPSGPVVKGPSFRAELQRFRLAEGSVVFIDAKSRPVLTLEKVDVDALVAPDMTVEGTFYVARMEVAGALKPKKIGGPFTWDGQVLNLPGVVGTLAGGNLTADFRVVALGEPSFTLGAKLDGVLLKKLVEDANVEPGKTDGELMGTLELAGDPRRSDTLTGRGHFELVSAQLRPMEFLVKVGELFQIDELQLLKLHDAKVDLTIADEKVQIDDLILKSENLILTGKGPVRFNGKLKIEARLLVNSKLQDKLKGLLGDKFVESEVPDYRQLPFSVTGRIDNPKTDLLDKITGIKMGNEVPGLLKNLFQILPQSKSGSGKKKNDQN